MPKDKHAFLIGVIGAIASLLLTIVFVLLLKSNRFLAIFLSVGALVAYCFVIVGSYMGNSLFFVAFFLFIPLAAIAQLCLLVYLSIIGGVLIEMPIDEIRRDDFLGHFYNLTSQYNVDKRFFFNSLGILLIIFGIGFFVSAVIQSYFYYQLVVSRIRLNRLKKRKY
ncbi:hypothetical protein M3Y98_01170900 [Aphelenchoides besseyi]|nr:hypothetical protein M3Y98_01170900 [Aphelenchoides besseyi]KAI6210967.1 hypothetical protein M3Y96_00383600 [Aphelenchoides besseyi]